MRVKKLYLNLKLLYCYIILNIILNIVNILIALMFDFLSLIAENIRNKTITSIYQYFVYVLLYNPYFLYSIYSRIRYFLFAKG